MSLADDIDVECQKKKKWTEDWQMTTDDQISDDTVAIDGT